MGTKGMDKYTRIKQIGEGSFGKALLVRSKENGKQMVVKEINMSKMGYKEREEARKEVAVLAQLGHPNIVSYRESFEEIGNLYIVMDYCDGGDLYSRINAQRGILFGEDVILDWFVQCCLAIKHIHDRKILHRDIKSQNIFLTRHGIVKLGDFGIAKVLNSTVELARTCIGTPYYLSPEICENRPYNNKSDIWSLGCVLYELTTLKHAFEAGNMKNLVLKIIRGSYPAPSPRFSYDLRSLINALFKRSARDRPSITTVLKKPLLQTRIRKFLSESEMASEFSHTVMHGVRLKKALPPGGARPLPPKPVPVQAKRAPTPVKYNPASVYGPSVARKSKERKSVEAKKSVEVRRSAGSAPRKPSAGNAGIAAANNDLVKKRQRLLEEERKRREEARKKDKDAAYAKQHKDLMDKQRMARMNRAREDGWKSVISSGESNDSDMSQTFSVSSLKRSLRRTKIAHGPKKSPYLGSTPRKEEVKKTPPTPVPKAAAAGGGKYDHYHAYLDKLDQDRKAGVKPQPAAQGVRASRDNATPVPGFNPAQAAKQGQVAGARAAMAAGRARDTEDAMAKKRNAAAEEFLNRKRAAAANKARAQRDLLGNAGAAGVAGAISPRRGGPSPYPRPAADRPLSAREQREKQEQDYLAKLKQIRLQNFNERRMQHEHKQGIADPKYKPPVTPDKDQDSRRKKIDALRAQAEDRAKKLKEDLEKKRKEAYDYERKQLKQGAANKPKPSEKPATPAKPVPVTEVMKAIGVSKDEPISVQPIKTPIGMTAAMKAIGAGSDQTAQSPEEDPARASSPLQKKKDDILKRLNSKPPVANKPDRGKWGEPAKPAIQPPSRWGEGDGNVLAGMALEETGSHMDATSAQDKVVKHLDFKEAEEVKDQEDQSGAVVTPRRQWGRPGDTVVNALNQAEISQTDATIHVKGGDSTQATPGGKTVTIPNDKQHKKEVTEQTKPKEVKVPEVTVGHVAGKGTVVIKKTEETSKSSAPDSKDDDTEEEKIILIKLPDDEPSVTESVAMELEPPKQGESKPQSSLFEKVELEDEDDRKSPEKDDTHLEDVEDEKDDEKEPKKEADKSQGIDEDEEKDEEEEEEDREQESKKTLPKQKSAEIVVAGLTTGHFDIDVKMLRTCSEPDLAKLFRTNIAENPFLLAEDDLSASVDIVALEAEMRRQLGQDDDDADDSVLDDLNENGDIGGSSGDGDEEAKDEEGKASDAEKSDASQDSEERKDSEEEEDGEEDGEEDKENEDEDEEDADSDDEDMRTLRESMMNILETEDVDEEEEKLVTSSKKKKKSTKKTKTKSKRKTKTAKEIDEGAELPQQQPGFSRQWSESSVEDLKTLRETMQSLLQPNSQGEKKKATLRAVPEVGGGDADTVDMPSILADMENWQSDGDDDDFFEEEENTFSRLEEKRVHLEQELGCETFLKAYKTVQECYRQAIHEDEDENMEEGIQLVSEILGPTQAHHYPAILQLVMADGVFTEDND